MTQEELMGLIGVLGGVGGSYFLGDRQAKKEKKEKKEDRLADYEFKKMMRDEDREYQKQLKEDEKAERIKEDESKFTVGDIFDPGNIFSQGISYDDMSPTDIALAASMFVPGLGLAGLAGRAGLGALRAGRAAKGAGSTGLGASMMDSLSDYFKTPTGTAGAGTGAPFTLPFFNDGGRVNMDEGGLSFFIDPEMDADGFEIPRDPSEVGMGNMVLEALGNLVRGAKIENDGYSFPRQPNKIRKNIYDLIGFDASNYPGFDDLTEFYGAED